MWVFKGLKHETNLVPIGLVSKILIVPSQNVSFQRPQLREYGKQLDFTQINTTMLAISILSDDVFLHPNIEQDINGR